VQISRVEIDDQTFARGFASATGLPLSLGQAVATLGKAIREGYFAIQNDVVEELTGSPALSLKSVVIAEQSAAPSARPGGAP
jgi:hypothetical protein